MKKEMTQQDVLKIVVQYTASMKQQIGRLEQENRRMKSEVSNLRNAINQLNSRR